MFFIFTGRAEAYVNEFDPPHWSTEGYKANYFLFGTDLTKLSLSFKIRMIQDSNLYFAYTQLMFWELWANSSPFRDLNYNPEFFYRIVLNGRESTWLDVGLFEHESNGLGGSVSRGWDRSYLRYSSGEIFGTDHAIRWSMKVWALPYIVDPNNMDIGRYRGTYELEISGRDFFKDFFDRNDITIRLYPGGPSYCDPTKGGQEIIFRINRLYLKPILPMFTIEFFHGYGENMLDYKTSRTEIRVGIGF